MSPRKRRRRFSRPPCDALHPDDGHDPREWAKAEPRPVQNRKALQLCRQASRALHLALAGCGDPVLNDLVVLDVRPFPDTTRLRVAVRPATAAAARADVLARLHSASGLLRQAVAAAINRRRTPELVFQVG